MLNPVKCLFGVDKSEEQSLIFYLLQFNGTIKKGEKLFQAMEDSFLRALQCLIYNIPLFICIICVKKIFEVLGN